MTVRFPCIAFALAATLGTASISAQVTSATPYGQPGLFQTPFDPVLTLILDQPRVEIARLVLIGGFTGDPGALLISAAPANIPLGNFATIYVASPALAVPGVFDPNGELVVSFNPQMPTLSGVTLYFQGVDLMLSGGGQLSNGMEVAFEK